MVRRRGQTKRRRQRTRRYRGGRRGDNNLNLTLPTTLPPSALSEPAFSWNATPPVPGHIPEFQTYFTKLDRLVKKYNFTTSEIVNLTILVANLIVEFKLTSNEVLKVLDVLEYEFLVNGNRNFNQGLRLEIQNLKATRRLATWEPKYPNLVR